MDISGLENHRALVILRHDKPFNPIELLGTLNDAGFSYVEISLTTPDALFLIEQAVRELNTSMCIGAGTVMTIEQLKGALDIGAQYIVSPLFDPEIVSYCINNSVAVFPGALTPGEIYLAHRSGAAMVKVFPSLAVGPDYFRSILAPMPEVKLLAVGGIRTDTICDYLEAGAAAVAIGSGIIRQEWIESEDYASIYDTMKSVADILSSFDC